MIDLEITDGVAFITVNAPATRNALNNELPASSSRPVTRPTAISGSAPPSSGGRVARSAPEPSAATWTRSDAIRSRRAGTRPSAASTGPSPGRPARDADHSRGPRGGGRSRDQPDARRRPADRRRRRPADQRLPADRAAPGRRPLRAAGRARGSPRAAAAAGIFGEEISGLRAVQLGLAWEALPSERVEERAAELARRAARDPQLARKAVASLRIELGPPRLPWAAALEVERGAQLWSLRRRASQ